MSYRKRYDRGDVVADKHLAKVAIGIMRWGLLAAALAAAVAVIAGMPALHAAARTAEITIIADRSSSGGFAFNGNQRGAMTVTVPVGWQIVVHFENTDTIGHSLGVLPSGAHQQPAPPASPAFAGAITSNFAAGLPKGSAVTFTFDASKAGTYEFVCGVPGHAISGQWDALVVSATAEAPSVTPAGAATITVK
jgi:sulfocyanin